MILRTIGLFLFAITLVISDAQATAYSCRRVFIDAGTKQIMPLWNSQFESKLTYKLSPEQMSAMEHTPNDKKYEDWLKNYLSKGWSIQLLRENLLPRHLFRAFRNRNITLHEFMTGMFFHYVWREAEEIDAKQLIVIDEKNIDAIINQEIFPLTLSHRREFKKRVLRLQVHERVLLRKVHVEDKNFLTKFSLLGPFGTLNRYDTMVSEIEDTNVYPFVTAPGTKATRIYTTNRTWQFEVTILSASVRQILSDVIHGENSVQHVPVIGKENSFDMAETFALGGRSIAMYFPEVKAHLPHDVDPKEFPLTTSFHDYFHNERASRTPRKTRTQLVPYLLRLIQSKKGPTWRNVTLVYSQTSDGKNLQKLQIAHQLKFLGAQDAVEAFTDLETYFKLEYYLNDLALPKNLDQFPFENDLNFIDHYVTLSIIFEDMKAHPKIWKSMGYGQQWLRSYLELNANYRARFLFKHPAILKTED